MKSIVEAAHQEGLIRLWQVEADPEPEVWEVGFAEHCHFPPAVLSQPHIGAVIIRDPRDVIISGAHYHSRSTEPWLNVAEDRFDGRTYRESISALDNDEERFCFEMDFAGGDTIRHMVDFVARSADFRCFMYEALVTDYSLSIFNAFFEYLDMPMAVRKRLAQIAREKSIFGGAKSDHIRCGLPQQWRTIFSPAMKQHFAGKLEDSIIILGYEPTLEQ